MTTPICSHFSMHYGTSTTILHQYLSSKVYQQLLVTKFDE